MRCDIETTSIISRLALIAAPCVADALGADERACLTLRRAWPRAEKHLLLEYVTSSGRIIPGQWMEDVDCLRTVVRQTADCSSPNSAFLVRTNNTHVLLQLDGADRRLSLRSILAEQGATLIVHRPERRAVVRSLRDGAVVYHKVVRPSAVSNIVRASVIAEELLGGGPGAASVLAHDEARSVVTFASLPGRSLFDWLTSDVDPDDTDLFHHAGALLRRLHRPSPALSLPTHSASSEARVLKRWRDHAAAYFPSFFDRLEPALRRALDQLEGLDQREPMSEPVIIHRDLHDKQFLVEESGAVGLIDLDTLSIGDPALDIANMLAHIELRTLQGRCSPDRAQSAARAFLAGCDGSGLTPERLQTYSDTARLRLACVYLFRPAWGDLSDRLIANPGSPPLGLEQ